MMPPDQTWISYTIFSGFLFRPWISLLISMPVCILPLSLYSVHVMTVSETKHGYPQYAGRMNPVMSNFEIHWWAAAICCAGGWIVKVCGLGITMKVHSRKSTRLRMLWAAD